MAHTADDTTRLYTAVSRRQLVEVVIVGAVVGLLVWVLAGVLDVHVFQRWLCGENGSVSYCSEASNYANATAMIIGALVGLFLLIRAMVYRPLLIVLAVTLALWGLPTLTAPLHWFAGVLAAVLLTAIAYLAFTWLARLQSILLSLVTVVVVVLITRAVFIG